MSPSERSPEGRYQSPLPDQLDPEQAVLYRSIADGPRKSQSSLTPVIDEQGRLLGPFGLMAIAPALGDAVQAVGAALRFHGEFDDLSRELVIMMVAAHHHSDFEWFAHENAARAAGLSEQQIAAIAAEGVPPGLAPGPAVAHATARLILDTGHLDDVAYAQAVAALSETRLAELVWLCGYYSMVATALSVFDPVLPSTARGAFARSRAH